MIRVLLTLAVVVTAMAGGCVTNPQVPRRPARISHIVFVKLQDASDAEALVHDADATLGIIPSLASYAAGGHFDMGRTEVMSDYDVAMYMGFMTPEDYQTYLAHPAHTGFVERWKPRCAWLKIHDMIDETP